MARARLRMSCSTSTYDFPNAISSLSNHAKNATSSITAGRAQPLLDPDELVVLRGAVRAGEGAGFDLPAIRRHGEVGARGIFRLARPVRHDRGVAGAIVHLSPFPRFRSDTARVGKGGGKT